MGIYLFLHLTINSNILDLVEAMSCQKLLNWIHKEIWYVYSTYNQIHCIYRKEYMYYLNVSCVIEAQNMVHFRIVLKITSFLQRMSDKELHRRLVTGTINTCSVTAKTVTMLSTNAQKSITQAKVLLLL